MFAGSSSSNNGVPNLIPPGLVPPGGGVNASRKGKVASKATAKAKASASGATKATAKAKAATGKANSKPSAKAAAGKPNSASNAAKVASGASTGTSMKKSTTSSMKKKSATNSATNSANASVDNSFSDMAGQEMLQLPSVGSTESESVQQLVNGLKQVQQAEFHQPLDGKRKSVKNLSGMKKRKSVAKGKSTSAASSTHAASCVSSSTNHGGLSTALEKTESSEPQIITTKNMTRQADIGSIIGTANAMGGLNSGLNPSGLNSVSNPPNLNLGKVNPSKSIIPVINLQQQNRNPAFSHSQKTSLQGSQNSLIQGSQHSFNSQEGTKMKTFNQGLNITNQSSSSTAAGSLNSSLNTLTETQHSMASVNTNATSTSTNSMPKNATTNAGNMHVGTDVKLNAGNMNPSNTAMTGIQNSTNNVAPMTGIQSANVGNTKHMQRQNSSSIVAKAREAFERKATNMNPNFNPSQTTSNFNPSQTGTYMARSNDMARNNQPQHVLTQSQHNSRSQQNCSQNQNASQTGNQITDQSIHGNQTNPQRTQIGNQNNRRQNPYPENEKTDVIMGDATKHGAPKGSIREFKQNTSDKVNKNASYTENNENQIEGKTKSPPIIIPPNCVYQIDDEGSFICYYPDFFRNLKVEKDKSVTKLADDGLPGMPNPSMPVMNNGSKMQSKETLSTNGRSNSAPMDICNDNSNPSKSKDQDPNPNSPSALLKKQKTENGHIEIVSKPSIVFKPENGAANVMSNEGLSPLGIGHTSLHSIPLDTKHRDIIIELLEQNPWTMGNVKIFGKETPEPRLTCYYGEKEAKYRYSGRELVPIPFYSSKQNSLAVGNPDFSADLRSPKIITDIKKMIEAYLLGGILCQSENIRRLHLGHEFRNIGGVKVVEHHHTKRDSPRKRSLLFPEPGEEQFIGTGSNNKNTINFNSVLLNRYRNGNDKQGWHSDNESVYGPRPFIASVTFGAERDFQFRRKDDHARKLQVKLENGSLLFMGGPIQQHWEHCLPVRKGVKAERVNLTFRKVIPEIAQKLYGRFGAEPIET